MARNWSLSGTPLEFGKAAHQGDHVVFSDGVHDQLTMPTLRSAASNAKSTMCLTRTSA